MSDSPPLTTVAVTGDAVVDYHLYEGERPRAGQRGERGVRQVRQFGGAPALRLLLAGLVERDANPRIRVLAGDIPDEESHLAHAFGTWSPYPISQDDPRLVWRARLLGYGDGDGGVAEKPKGMNATEPSAPPNVLVIDDADLGFRSEGTHSPLIAVPPNWIVFKTTAPVARGDLWRRLADDHAERLVCVLSADDLRREHSTISRGLAWERTAADLGAALLNDPVLVDLSRCRHLVVTLGSDGALWIDAPPGEVPRATLLFDAKGIEGEWTAHRPGEMTGYLAVMAAALAMSAARHVAGADPDAVLDLAPGIVAGLTGARDLAEFGHGLVDGGAPRGFPTERVAMAICDGEANPAFSSILLPSLAPASYWTILGSSQVPAGAKTDPSALGLARTLVIHGPHRALHGLPQAAFGKLVAIDRREIESLRSIRSLMQAYATDLKVDRPLSIGIFGPPGAGKSFGVQQLAREIFGESAWLEFNLSQFGSHSDLMGPFHKGRDLVLRGITPVIFWDEFDSRELEWLRYLIAPMQDGRFQDGERTHSVGRAVFVFAGGTSPTFAEFAPTEHNAQVTFRHRKGPDFLSRLDAFFDVSGPNPRRSTPTSGVGRDIAFTVRRAQLIRRILAGNSERDVDIDSDLLNALLLVPAYRHGARSLEKLVKWLGDREGAPVRRSNLPPPEALDMFVDATAFQGILDQNAHFRMNEAVEAQAAAIHAAYRQHALEAGETVDPKVDRDFDHLEASEQEDNRAAARRTVDVLALAGIGVVPAGLVPSITEAEYGAHIEHHLERLAEAEHAGWMTHRLANGWKHGEVRDFSLRTHPCLVSYQDLSESNRRKDRRMVRDYARRIHATGFSLVWLEGSALSTVGESRST